MTPELEALGRRAVACAGWRWMPGMLRTDGGRVVGSDGARLFICQRTLSPDADGQMWPDLVLWPADDGAPDISDPATLGCLLALVEEAAGGPAVVMHDADDGSWWLTRAVVGGVANPLVAWLTTAPSRARALVAALEATEARR
jgi:hypothetical protein